MKKIDLGQIVNTLANVGVIAGIVFLAFELRQNNSLLRAQASYNLLQDRNAMRVDVIRDPELAEFWAQNMITRDLSATELRVRMRAERVFLNWQYEYGQYEDGNLRAGEFSTSAMQRAFVNNTGLRESWKDFREQLRPDFVQWVEENLLAE